ncbi:hypothetical protein KUTeg_000216 [Tegillarca granosa]|uniref:glutaminase n=1 Tax=Tegillarca granosa TaxID=220873 RepID=A0ABQ9FZP1_TEGGR|nr:hypothetical protein KUTeg_000216 [Tegillarca granosa]
MYALVTDEHGPDHVHNYVGQEPSGRSFNEISLDYKNKPHNPMINPGAIITTSLFKSDLNIADRFDFCTQTLRRMTGGEYLAFNNAIFLSERQTADRNFALAYFLRENKNPLSHTCKMCFPDGDKLMEVLDFYFQVGLPAKSGVSGGVMLVIPNVMGIAMWSPPLDQFGNSCRSIQFCQDFVAKFNFHHYDDIRHSGKKMDPRRSKIETHAHDIVSLLFGAAKGDLTAIRRYAVLGLDMELGDYDGRTALHIAAAEGQDQIVQFLLEKCRVSPSLTDR